MLMINSVPRAWCMDPDGVYSELSSSSSPFELAMALVAFGSPEHDDYVSDFTVSPTSDSPVRRRRCLVKGQPHPRVIPSEEHRFCLLCLLLKLNLRSPRLARSRFKGIGQGDQSSVLAPPNQ